jgi:hypothetical protein
MAVYLPSAQSFSHRARISALVSPLRRTKPRVPFWQLASHRIPTLWNLYRGLLRDAPSSHIRTHLKWFVRKNQHVTAPLRAQAVLKKLHGVSEKLSMCKNHACAYTTLPNAQSNPVARYVQAS